MSKQYDVAVVGATGAVGEAMIEVLEQRDFPLGELFPLASERSAGSTVMFKGRPRRVGNLQDFDFSKAQVALFSAGASVSAVFAPQAAAAGCVVIDNSSQFRTDPQIPLVVPEVNPAAVADYVRHNIIANPNCSPYRCWWRSSRCTMPWESRESMLRHINLFPAQARMLSRSLRGRRRRC